MEGRKSGLIGKGFTNLFFLSIFFIGIFILISAAPISVPSSLDFNLNSTATYDADGTVAINWSGGTETNFTIYISNDSGTVWFKKTWNDSVTGFLFVNTTPGNYTFRVAEVYIANATEGTNSSDLYMNVDTSAPAVPTDFDFNLNSTATYDADGTVAINWTAGGDLEVNYSIYISNDSGATYFSKAENDSATGFLFVNTTEGNYTFNVSGVDLLGREGTNTSILYMNVDTSAPAINLPVYTNATFKENSSSLTLNVSVIDASSGETSSACIFDINGTNQTVAVSTNWCNITVGNLTGLADGNQTISVYVNDTVNNLGLNNSFVVQMDSTNPLLDYNTSTESNNTNFSRTYIYANITLTETNPSYFIYRLYNSTSEVNTTSYTSAIRSFNWTSLSDGNYTYNVTVNDSAGNSNTTLTRTISLDTVNSSVTLNTPVSDANLSTVSNATILNATVTDATSNVSSVVFNISNSSSYVTFNANYSGGYWINATFNTTNFEEGSHNLTVIATDYAGNINNSVMVNFTVDNIIPSLNSSNITDAYYNGSDYFFSPSNQDGLYDSISIVANSSETIDWGTTRVYNSTSYAVKTFNSVNDNTSILKTWDGNETASGASKNWADGTYIINITITDPAGNSNGTQIATNLFADNTGPNISSLNKTPSTSYNNDSVVINASIVDALLNTSSVWIKGNWNGTFVNYTLNSSSGNNNYSYTITSGNFSNQEIVNYTWYANDTIGNEINSSLQSFTVTNRVPAFNSSLNISDLSWVEDSGQGNVNLTSRFYDFDNDSLNHTAIVNDTNITVSINNITKIATLTSETDWNGNATVTFYAVDAYSGNGSSNVVNITVLNDANEPPLLTSPVSPVNFSEDLNTTFTLICSPGTGENATQNCTNYRYDSSYSGYDSNVSVTVNSTTGVVFLNASLDWYNTTYVKFQVDDNGTPVQTDDLIILINVTSVNDLPVINYSAGTFNQTQIEDYGNWTLNLTIFETDVDFEDVGTNLTWTIGNVNTSLINATLNTTTEIITFTTVANAQGTNSLTINLTDSNNATTNATLLVNITSVNDIPLINTTIPNQSIYDNTTSLSLDLSSYCDDSNDSNTNLFWTVSNINTSLWTIPITGINYPSPLLFQAQSGIANLTNVTDTINFSCTDTVNSSSQNVTFTIIPFNDAPSVISDTGRTPTNNSNVTSATNQFTLDWANSTDPENQTLSYYIFLGNTTTPSLNGTSSISQYNASNLTDNTTYYWNVIASDSVKNSSASTTWQFTTDFDNAPNITAYAPLTNSTISENQTLEFNATIYDSDGNNMTYNWTIDDLQNSTGTTSTNNETIFFNYTPSFNNSGSHTIKLSFKDTNNNSGTARSWLITVSNNNRAPTLDAIINYSVNEDSILTFNITGSDLDSDTLTYSSNLSSITITKTNNTLANVSWTPTNSNVGINLINFSLSDGTTTVYQTVTITINNTNDAPTITTSSPTSDPLIKNGTNQTFSVSTSDVDNDTLTITWYINGTSSGTGSSKNITQTTSNSSDIFNITSIVSDGNTTILKTWYLTITSIPITNTFTGSGTTNFSAISNLSSAENIVLAETDGKINFSGEVLDLSNVLDLDNNVKIENGIVAINSSKYSQLNKSATITLTGLSYDKVPKIFYNNGFTTTSNEITTECDFCNVVSFTDAPTSSGTVVFEVDHFSSFKVGESESEFDLDSFDDLDLCEEGIQGDLELEIEKPDEGDDFQVGDTIKIRVEVTNDADEDKDIIVEASLYNVDEDDEEESVESDEEEINEGDSETYKLEIDFPNDFNDGDDYVIFVKAYEDNEEEDECDQDAVEINLEREKHDVIIKDVTLTPQIVYSSNKINVFVDVENVGSNDEDVYVTLENSALEISERSETFELEEYGDDDFSTQMFFVKIPSDAEEGEYLFKIKVIFDDGSDERTETISVLKALSLTTGFDGSFTNLIDEEKRTEVIKIEKESKKLKVIDSKKLSNNNYLFVFALGFGIIILFLLIITVLNLRKRR